MINRWWNAICQYWKNCQKIVIFRMNVNNIFSSSSDHKKMKYSSLDSPYWGASDGGIFMSLALMDKRLFTFYVLEIFCDSQLSIAARDTIILSFDASQWDESNELCFIILWSLDDEKMLITFILKRIIFWQFFNIDISKC